MGKGQGQVGRVAIKDRMFLVDKSGRGVTPVGIDFIGIQSEGMIRVWSGRKEGFVDTAGKLVIPPRFDQTAEFSEGLARIYESGTGGGRYGYIDKGGRIAIPAQYSFARPFNGPLAAVVNGRESAYVDVDGKVVWRSE